MTEINFIEVNIITETVLITRFKFSYRNGLL